ncbi:MAG: hypothetical protein WD552_02765 [Candidatus Paceibacterota bacterium]
MAKKFPPSSFIPKGGAQYSSPAAPPSRRNFSSLLLNASIVIVAIAALAAGGVFFYTQYLQSDLSEKKQQFTQVQAAFDSEIIDELHQVDERINSVQRILNNHTAVTPVLAVIEDITLESVQLTSLVVMSPEAVAQNQRRDEDMTPRVDVSIIGVARDYAAVALQSQALSENEAIQKPVLSGFSLNDQGNVEFVISFSLSPEYMDYENTL